MIAKLTSIVPAAAQGLELSRYIDRAWPMLGKARAAKLIRQKQVKLNGKRVQADCRLKAEDEIVLYVDGGYDTSLRILFDDGFIAAFYKPQGLPVDVDAQDVGEDTALMRLRLVKPDVRLVHRLDAGTGGVMLAALCPEAEKLLLELFRLHLLSKTYLACVCGKLEKPGDRLTGFLLKDEAQAKVRVVQQKAPDALGIETIYTLVETRQERGETVSWLKVEIPTGRTHQIRAHMASIGHPLVGDDKYGRREVNRALNAREPRLYCKSIEILPSREAGTYGGMRFEAPAEEIKWDF